MGFGNRMVVGITQNVWPKLVMFYRECWRVLRVTRKPSNIEFKTIVKVSALGIAIIGLIGFLLDMIMIAIKPMLGL